ncbi:head-tail joining protein [Endozoicomonas ascidiicola]|uniref:head-tail joining protein n=1 Tax=Endozoicomonas ascidiicola TaxID=1698521 RepID=UPI000833600E|nr:hypothetical protein [Endozoicomonas ascidiicola]
MDEAIKTMDHTVLSTFGQSVLLTLSDQSSLETKGIIAKELVPLGQHEAIQGEVTVLSVDSAVRLKRGDTVLANGQTYEVDRKLKDDGYLAKWNIYAH